MTEVSSTKILVIEVQVALDAVQAEILVQRRDDEQGVDIGGDQLLVDLAPRRLAAEQALALQQAQEAALGGQQQPVADRDRRHPRFEREFRRARRAQEFDAVPVLRGHPPSGIVPMFQADLLLKERPPAES